jgi:hypothetical protein
MHDVDQIKQELRYINEILAMKGDADVVIENTYAQLCVDHVVPLEYKHYTQYDTESLKRHKNRLETDLEQAQKGLWDKNKRDENQEI